MNHPPRVPPVFRGRSDRSAAPAPLQRAVSGRPQAPVVPPAFHTKPTPPSKAGALQPSRQEATLRDRYQGRVRNSL